MEEVPWVFADQKKSPKLEVKDKGKDYQDVAATLLITMASDTMDEGIKSPLLPSKRAFNWLDTVLSEEKYEKEEQMNVHPSSFDLTTNTHSKPQTQYVSMFYDALCTKEIPPNTQINKDIIFYFSLAGAVPPSSFGSRLSIDEKVLYLGKRKTFQGGQPFPHTICAVLLDNHDRQEIELCSTCRRKNEQILKIRSALIDDKGLIKVATSVTCSGNPPSNKRALVVSFTIVDKDQKVVWAHESAVFTIFHHRSKQKLRDNKCLKLEQDDEETCMNMMNQSRQQFSTVSLRVAEEIIAASLRDESLEKIMTKLITEAMRQVYMVGPSTLQVLSQYFHPNFNYSPVTEDVPFATSAVEKFLQASLMYSSRLDDVQWILEEGICKGTLSDGKISTRIRMRGKWTRPMLTHEPTGEIVEPVFHSFWTIRDNKIFFLETTVNHSGSLKWRLAWQV